MAFTVEDAQALRIAIAIAALRHKPRNQTYESYVLDLQAQFPLPSSGAAESSPWRERALALERELQALQDKYYSDSLELLTLRAKTRDIVPTAPASAPLSGSGEPGTGKKKSKKGGKGAPPFVSACVSSATKIDNNTSSGISTSSKALFDDSNLCSTFPEVFRTPSLLIPLEVLELKHAQLLHQKRKRIDETYVLATERALDAAADLLAQQLPPQEARPNAPNVIKALCRVVPYILSTTIPKVFSGRSSPSRESGKSGTNIPLATTTTATPAGATTKPKCSENTTSAVDRVLGRVSTNILNPLVRSFAPLSDRQLSMLISPHELAIANPRTAATKTAAGKDHRHNSNGTGNKNKNKNGIAYVRSTAPRACAEDPQVIDIRYDLLGLFHQIIEGLRELGLAEPNGALASSIRNVVQCVTLEAIRELERLYGGELSQAERNLGETLPPPHAQAAGAPESSSSSASSSLTSSTPDSHTHSRSHSHSDSGTHPHKPEQNLKINQNQNPSPPSDRLAKVSRKDTLWFLSSILHLLLSQTRVPVQTQTSSVSLPSFSSFSSSGSSSDPRKGLEASSTTGSLLEEAIYTALSGMLRRMRTNSCHTIHTIHTIDDDDDYTETEDDAMMPMSITPGDSENVGTRLGEEEEEDEDEEDTPWSRDGVIDEVERGMILAVIERAALAG